MRKERLDGEQVFVIHDFLSREEYHATDIYQHVYRPMGVEHQVAVAMPSPSDLTIGIALSRKRRDFSQRDRDVLDLARPHLIQAWRTARRRSSTNGAPARSDIRDHLLLLGMSAREADVLELLMHGESTESVAARLSISPRTVHKHSERIRDKLGVHSRAEDVAAAWSSVAARTD